MSNLFSNFNFFGLINPKIIIRKSTIPDNNHKVTAPPKKSSI